MTRNHAESQINSQENERNNLISSIGEAALANVELDSQDAILGSLLTLADNLGFKSKVRRQELFPALAALGGQTLTSVDLVLNVRDIVGARGAVPRGYVSSVLDDKWVPSYLEVLTSDEDELNTLKLIWFELIDKKYGVIESQRSRRKEERKYGAKSQSRSVTSFSKNAKKVPLSVKPKRPTRQTSRKKQFDPNKSDSFKRTFNNRYLDW